MTLAKADNSPQAYNPAQLALFLPSWLLFLCHAVLPVLHLQHLIKMTVLFPHSVLSGQGLTFGSCFKEKKRSIQNPRFGRSCTFLFSVSTYADLVGGMDRQTQEKVRRKSNGIDDFDRFVNGVIRTPSSTTRTPSFFSGGGCSEHAWVSHG